jgi:hypothetical protein
MQATFPGFGVSSSTANKSFSDGIEGDFAKLGMWRGLIPPQYSGQNHLYLLVELFVIVGTIFLL